MMNNDLDEKSREEDTIFDIAYKNIIINGFLIKALEVENKKEPIDDIVKNCTKILENIFKANYNKINVVKKTMKMDSQEKLEKTKVLDYSLKFKNHQNFELKGVIEPKIIPTSIKYNFLYLF